MTVRTDFNTAKKRSLVESQKSEGAEEQAPGSLYSAGLNVDTFLGKFDAAPKGTVSAWEGHIKKVMFVIGRLKELKNGSPDNIKQQFQALLGTEQRKTFFDGPLDMEIDWSDVDSALASEPTGYWTCIGPVHDIKDELGNILTKLKETKSCLKGLCLFSNQTEVSTFVSQTRESPDDGVSDAQIAAMMVGVKAASF
jgi:hypothetical protein